MKQEWDDFVARSRNGTFLMRRDYMDYHSHLFADHSLMAYRYGRLCAVLPANVEMNVLQSHGGLTYGGWLWPERGIDTTDIFWLWTIWMSECAKGDIESVIYKPVPTIYHRTPSQEDLYMLFLFHGRPVRCDISTAIDLQNNPGFNNMQRRHLRSAAPTTAVRTIDDPESPAWREFYNLLQECLDERHNTVPVHSAEELILLKTRFPQNIVVWGAYEESTGLLQGAVCAYITDTCVHCQYIATSREGRERNVLSVLFDRMIKSYTEAGMRYFDFGISNEDGGLALNPGLNRQKTSYGGSGVVYSHYDINVYSAVTSSPTELWPPRSPRPLADRK